MGKHCPLAFCGEDIDISCSEEYCQWWDEIDNCCAVKTIAKVLGQQASSLSAIYEEVKVLRKINQIMNANVME